MKRKKKIKRLIIVFSIVVVIISLYFCQKYFLFFPSHDEQCYNYLLENDDYKNIVIDNNGKKLTGWFKKNTEKEKAPVVMYFGGNAQNSSNTLVSWLVYDKYKYFEGYNIVVMDYPGYGLSEGQPSDKTMFDSALKMYDYISLWDNVDKDNIVVVGFSIGTGVATYLASQRDVNGLILVAPYDEILSLYNSYINIFHGPIKKYARYGFKSKEYAPNVKTDPLIITSYDDEIISYKFSLNLANYFKNINDIKVLNNIKHDFYFSQKEVLEYINDYLKSKLN